MAYDAGAVSFHAGRIPQGMVALELLRGNVTTGADHLLTIWLALLLGGGLETAVIDTRLMPAVEDPSAGPVLNGNKNPERKS
jgi:hypothetical protein